MQQYYTVALYSGLECIIQRVGAGGKDKGRRGGEREAGRQSLER